MSDILHESAFMSLGYMIYDGSSYRSEREFVLVYYFYLGTIKQRKTIR
jgi:hypothetical protein